MNFKKVSLLLLIVISVLFGTMINDNDNLDRVAYDDDFPDIHCIPIANLVVEI